MAYGTGKFIDLVPADTPGTGGTGGSFTPTNVTVVENTLVTDIDTANDYREITYTNGLPTTIDVWETNSKLVKQFTVTIAYLNGLPVTKTVDNHTENNATIKTITYNADGLPETIQQ